MCVSVVDKHIQSDVRPIPFPPLFGGRRDVDGGNVDGVDGVDGGGGGCTSDWRGGSRRCRNFWFDDFAARCRGVFAAAPDGRHNIVIDSRVKTRSRPVPSPATRCPRRARRRRGSSGRRGAVAVAAVPPGSGSRNGRGSGRCPLRAAPPAAAAAGSRGSRLAGQNRRDAASVVTASGIVFAPTGRSRGLRLGDVPCGDRRAAGPVRALGLEDHRRRPGQASTPRVGRSKAPQVPTRG